ncbi:MAG TPA: PIN domain-containing protein [Flavobacteriales bacterium]|jgi:predicted nucleic acid-binding protein|nr:PIN domain-containing protein [Flavobacteriales bacterium]
MRFFLDTNVLFDLFQKERTNHVSSRELIKASVRGQVELVVSANSVMTMLYALRTYGSHMPEAIARLNLLLPHLHVVRIGGPELLAGINSGWSDLEDAIQFHGALAAGHIDAIVSNDNDFDQQKLVPVITPAQALKRVR